MTEETRGEAVEFLRRWNRVENGRGEPAQQCFFDPEKCYE